MADTANIHSLYETSVQTPDREVMNLLMMHRHIWHQRPHSGRYTVPFLLREDFCGTAALCKAWINKNAQHRAIGIDWDRSVISYALETHFQSLSEDPDRVKLYCANVLDRNPEYPPVDILVALNYSLCYFHTRSALDNYLTCLIRSSVIKSSGIFVTDLFGGYQYQAGANDNVQTTRQFPDFKYIFEQRNLDPWTNRLQCSISFKFKDGSAIKNALKYDFRLWSICEIREALVDAGFDTVHIWLIRRDRHASSAIDPSEDDSDPTEEDTGPMGQSKCVRIHPPDNEKTRAFLDDPHSRALLSSWNAYIVATIPSNK